MPKPEKTDEFIKKLIELVANKEKYSDEELEEKYHDLYRDL